MVLHSAIEESDAEQQDDVGEVVVDDVHVVRVDALALESSASVMIGVVGRVPVL
jgi:hypothetical protein